MEVAVRRISHASDAVGGSAISAPAPLRGGRPRDPSADRAILDVATRILQKEGYRNLNIERVAEESGIAKTTIYRRYRDRQDLAAAAVGSLLDAHGVFVISDTGSCREDLKAGFARFRSTGSPSPLLTVLGAVLSEGQGDPQLVERMWHRAFGPHQEAIATVIRRGIERGEVRADLAVGAAVEMLAGAVLARLIPGNLLDDDWIESVVATAWSGMRTGA